MPLKQIQMKKRFNYKFQLVAVAFGLMAMTGCNKYLDREPLSNVTPDKYLRSEADLAAYTVGRYSFPTHSGFNVGTHGIDNNTDNQASSG